MAPFSSPLVPDAELGEQHDPDPDGQCKIRQGAEKLVQSRPDIVTMERFPGSPRAKQAIEHSLEETRNLNHNYVGTEHLLLGLLGEPECTGAQVIIELGVRLEDVRREVLDLLGHSEK